MTVYGYARLSTAGQSLNEQKDTLKNAGADIIMSEKYSGTTTTRHQFEQLVHLVEPNDTLIVTKLDRFARNTREALKRGEKPLYVHSGMESQYTSELFENTLESIGIRHSYSRKGHPYDNARIESFHSLLKLELIYQRDFESIDDVQAAVSWYVN